MIEQKVVCKKMQAFSDMKKNMFLPIREGIEGVQNVMQYLQNSADTMAGYFKILEGEMSRTICRRVKVTRKEEGRGDVASKGAHTEEETEESLAPTYGKKTREPTMSHPETTASRPRTLGRI